MAGFLFPIPAYTGIVCGRVSFLNHLAINLFYTNPPALVKGLV